MRRLRNLRQFLFRFHREILGVTGMGLISIPIVQETFMLKTFKSIHSAEINNKPVTMDEDTDVLVKRVLTRLNLTLEQEHCLDFFVTSFPDAIHCGSSQISGLINTGAVVGLPLSFTFKTPEEMKAVKTTLGSKYMVDWESELGKQLLEKMFYTDQEKAFIIGREILYANSHRIYVKMFLATSALTGAYYSAYALDQFTPIGRMFKIWARGVLYSGVALLFLGSYSLLMNVYYQWMTYRTDYKLARLRPYYAQGGVDYYNKVLARNIIMRNMLGKDGRDVYKADGNEIGFFQTKLTAHRDNMLKYVKMWEDGELTEQELKEEQ